MNENNIVLNLNSFKNLDKIKDLLLYLFQTRSNKLNFDNQNINDNEIMIQVINGITNYQTLNYMVSKNSKKEIFENIENIHKLTIYLMDMVGILEEKKNNNLLYLIGDKLCNSAQLKSLQEMKNINPKIWKDKIITFLKEEIYVNIEKDFEENKKAFLTKEKNNILLDLLNNNEELNYNYFMKCSKIINLVDSTNYYDIDKDKYDLFLRKINAGYCKQMPIYIKESYLLQIYVSKNISYDTKIHLFEEVGIKKGDICKINNILHQVIYYNNNDYNLIENFLKDITYPISESIQSKKDLLIYFIKSKGKNEINSFKKFFLEKIHMNKESADLIIHYFLNDKDISDYFSQNIKKENLKGYKLLHGIINYKPNIAGNQKIINDYKNECIIVEKIMLEEMLLENAKTTKNINKI